MISQPRATPSDEMLVAFIDGELSAKDRAAVQSSIETDSSVAARLNLFKTGEMPYAAGFDELLKRAPAARLRSLVTPAAAPRENALRRLDRRWFLAAACVAGGVLLDRSIAYVSETAWVAGGHDWRSVVANYMMLYSTETLNNPTSGPGPGPQDMARLSDAVSLDVSMGKVELPGREIKRAQILQYEGAPLIQIAYLDPTSGPLAFCFMRKAGRDEALRHEQMLGLNIVDWSTSTHAFLVIGYAGVPELQDIATDLRRRLATQA